MIVEAVVDILVISMNDGGEVISYALRRRPPISGPPAIKNIVMSLGAILRHANQPFFSTLGTKFCFATQLYESYEWLLSFSQRQLVYQQAAVTARST